MPISLKIKRPSFKIKKFNTKLDFHNMTVLPILMLTPLGIFISMSLSTIGMQSLSYIIFGLFLLSFALMSILYIRDKEMSKYGLIHFAFMLTMMGLTALNNEGDLKNGFYLTIEVLLFLMMMHYYRDRIHIIIIGTTLIFSFCVYAGLLHTLFNPHLWFITEDKADSGYLLGDNYNGMGMRMIVALAYATMSTRYGKIWWINLIGVIIASFVPLIITGSKTSLTGISLFLVVLLIPSLRIKKFCVNSALVFFILFQFFVVFSGKGLENNKLAVYIVEDILKKDITFTYRTYLWDTAIQKISQSPIWGYGFVNIEWYAKNISIPYGIGPHNMILSVMVNGGIILLVMYITIIIIAMRNVYIYKDRYAVMARMASVTIMIMLLMEFQSYVFIMYILALAYYYPYINKEYEQVSKSAPLNLTKTTI